VHADRRYRRLVRRCRTIDQALDLPAPFDEARLLDQLARRRGRPIELMPVPAAPDLPCGLLVATGRADYILYRTDTGPLHRRHIVVHEVAHLLFDHAGAAPLAQATALLPHLSPALVQRVLGRTVYTEPQEQEAELLASMILSRVRRDAAGGPQGGAAPVPHLERLLEWPDPSPDAGPTAVAGPRA
jgi:hypothetical protein